MGTGPKSVDAKRNAGAGVGGLAGEMGASPAKLIGIQATLVGEQSPFGVIRPEDVPLAAGVDLSKLKEGDSAPLEVVVAVPSAKSTRGWNYKPSAIESICRQVASATAPGYLGHPNPAEIDHKFDVPVTHWVGAKWDADAPVKDKEGNIVGKGVGFLRGVIDAAATDLKRWIKSGRITTTSIFGEPKFGSNAKEVEVVDYALVSNDWTPLGRNGMPTQIVAYGEFDVIPGSGGPSGTRKDGDRMLIGEILAEMRKDRVTPGQVIGEMGWRQDEVLQAMGVKTLEDVAVHVEKDRFESLKQHSAVFGEMVTALGLDPKTATPEAAKTKLEGVIGEQKKATEAAHGERVKKVVGEMIPGEGQRIEAARAFVVKYGSIPLGSDEAQIKEKVGEMLKDETVKNLIGETFVAPGVHSVTTGEQRGSTNGGSAAATPTGLRKSTRPL